jgi:hypothetical protein
MSSKIGDKSTLFEDEEDLDQSIDEFIDDGFDE